jgi:tRNA pseudouridine38-40 synthase
VARIVRLTLEYDGTAYLGWQVQPQGPTIQSELERALGVMTGRRIRVTGAGRTDAGVHAAGQVASFVAEETIPAVGFARGLTRLLPVDIAVLAAADAPDGFDARRSARRKLYRYTLLNRAVRSPLSTRFDWHVRVPLDAAAMDEAARALVGTHDFSAFRTADPAEKSPVRRLDRLTVTRDGDRVIVEAEGPGFLKHMVRVIVGTLVEVGRGAFPPAATAAILASRDRGEAGPTAPPHGLCLVRVDYPQNDPAGDPAVDHDR